jgi:hypothetical protein
LVEFGTVSFCLLKRRNIFSPSAGAELLLDHRSMFSLCFFLSGVAQRIVHQMFLFKRREYMKKLTSKKVAQGNSCPLFGPSKKMEKGH